MLLIRKNAPPASLVAYRKDKFAYFDGCNKSDIRQALLEEQGNLCAYCMRRIDADHMKIEHWYPESLLSDNESLDYNNMLGCCEGHIEGDTGSGDTCDTHKGNEIISIDPRNVNHINQIQYRSKDGTIFSQDKILNIDLNNILNLNSDTHYLKQNRKAALDSFLQVMVKKQKNGQWNPNSLRKLLHEYEEKDTQGNRKEYAGIILWYINRKI